MKNKYLIEKSGLFDKEIMPGVDWYYAIPQTSFCVVVDDNTDVIFIAPQGDMTAGKTYPIRNYSTLICILKLLKLIK